MKIAVCDDEQEILDSLGLLLEKYAQMQEKSFSIDYYLNALDLLDVISSRTYDVIFFDVRMPGLDGITASKELRAGNTYTRLIFLSNYAEYAVDSYCVDAFYYLLKPLKSDILFPLLNRLMDCLEAEQSHCLLIQYKNETYRVPLSRLEYCESTGKLLQYHLTDKTIITAFDTIRHVQEQLLSYPNFIRPHRSFMVNMDCISSICSTRLEMRSQDILPIPKGRLKELRKLYLTYMMQCESTNER